MTPKLRQSVYLAGTIVSGVLGILLVWGGIDAGTAANIDQVVTGLGVLIGGGVTGVAAKTVRAQRKDGTFDTPADASPVEQVLANLPLVVAQANDAVADLGRVKRAAEESVGDASVVIGPLAKQALDKILNPS